MSVRPHHRAIALIASTLLLLAGLVVAASPSVAAPVCQSSSPSGGSYTVRVCLDLPAEGAVLSGDADAAATVTVTGGTNPGVRRWIFYLDNEYLLTDFHAPAAFEIPTAKFADGSYVLAVEALMRDGFTSQRTSINVTFNNGNATTPVNTNTFTPSTGRPAGGQPFRMMFTGDGADGGPDAAAVADLISTANPNLFAYVGDMYEKGSKAEFHNHYDGGGGQLWGAFKAMTNPVIGNHEYEGGVAPGYFDYWDNVPDYYSYDANGWHFIALNSNTQLNEFTPGTPQYDWLMTDLAGSNAACTVAYFHHPVVSVGPQGSTPKMNPIWQLLHANGVDIVVTGHDHSYQRFVPLDGNLNADPDGIVQFVAGGGGHGIQSFVSTDSRLAAGQDVKPGAVGALELTLNPDGASFAYRSVNGQTMDSGAIPCRGALDTEAPSQPGSLTATSPHGGRVDLEWQPSTDNVGVDHYSISRDGVEIATVPKTATSYTDTTVTPETAYVYEVRAVDAAGNLSTPASTSVTTAAAATSLTLNPVADAYTAANNAATNYGGAAQLRVDGDPMMRSFLKFTVSGLAGSVTSATLRVGALGNHGVGYEVHAVDSNDWTENGVTHANAPPVGTRIGSSGGTTSGAYNEIDVSSLITGNGTYSLSLIPKNNTNLPLSSREGSLKPELVVTTNPPGNDPPVAGNVTVTTDQGVTASWTPSVSDPNNDPVTCSIATPPSHGTATVENDCSAGTYAPTGGYTGSDSFTYRADDGTLTGDGTVSVIVSQGNQPPVANDLTATVSGATALPLSGSDPDGDCPQTFSIISGPSHGTLSPITGQTCNSGSAGADVTYTGSSGYSGPDSFTYTLTDPGGATSAVATVSLTVTPPGSGTTTTVYASADAYVDANRSTQNFGTNAQLRTDASPLIRSFLKFDLGVLPGDITKLTLRIRANSSLTAGYDVHAVANVTWNELTITDGNAPLVGNELATSGRAVAGSYNEIDLTGAITTGGLHSLALMPLSSTNLKLDSRETIAPPELIVETGNGSPPANQAPTAAPVSANASGATEIPLSGSDPDGDCPLTFTIVDQPSNGSVGPVGGLGCSTGSATASVTYTPDSGYSGPDSFTYRVDDGAATSAPATVSLTVVAPGTETVRVLNPVADAYTDASKALSNFGTSKQLRTDASPELRSFLRFDLGVLTGQITSVTLRIQAGSSLSNGYDVHGVEDTTWDENSITHANAPTVGSRLSTSGPASAGVYNEIDLTAFVTRDGLHSFALIPLSTTNLKLTSREGTAPPELVVKTVS